MSSSGLVVAAGIEGQAARPPGLFKLSARPEPRNAGWRLKAMSCLRNLAATARVRKASPATAITAAMLALIAACSNSPAPKYGSVTGLAAPCVGMILPGSVSAVTVYARHNGTVVKSERVVMTRWPGNRYELRLPPGSYIISAPLSDRPARTVSVRAHQTVTTSFLPGCK